MTATDTPRTDAEIWDVVYHHKNEIVVDADFARELERELAASNADVERLRQLLLVSDLPVDLVNSHYNPTTEESSATQL